jgi:hypothetical protein
MLARQSFPEFSRSNEAADATAENDNRLGGGHQNTNVLSAH